MKANRKGFTLIELLVVVAIIGILAGIILVGVGGALSKSRDSRRIAELRQIQNALELYRAKNGNYPAGPVANMVTTLTSGGTQVVKSVPTGVTPGGGLYEYYSAGVASYTLAVTLEDAANPEIARGAADGDGSAGCRVTKYCVSL